GHVLADEVVDLTRRLVQIPSVYRPGEPDANERAVADVVAGWLRREGFTVEVDEVAAGRPNVVGCLDAASPGPTLCFEGHTDVVPDGHAPAWRHGASSGAVPAGALYG